jgi:hypothetical protein
MLTNLVNKPAANRRHLYKAGRRLGESGEKSGQFWSTFLLYIYRVETYGGRTVCMYCTYF